MKRTGVLFLILTVGMMSFLQGCQQNPTSDVVNNKNEGKLESAIKETEDSGEKKTESIAVEDQFQVGDVSVSVNALTETTGKELPVVRVKPHEITVEEVQKWADVLFQGEKAYEPTSQLSKKDIEEIIISLRAESDHDKLLEEYGNEEDVELMLSYYNDQIKYYDELYEEAPETVEYKECEWQFHSYDYYMTDSAAWEGDESFENLKKTYQLKTIAEDVNGHEASIEATNRSESDYEIHSLWFWYTDEMEMQDIAYKEISTEDAVEMAESVLDDLDMESEWMLWNTEQYKRENGDGWDEAITVLNYTPVYEGVQTALGPEIDLQAEDVYAANLRYGSMEVTISNGIIKSLILESPMDEVQVENTNVKTLNMDDIYETFRNQADAVLQRDVLVDTSDPEAENGELTVEIDEIKQTLYRIREQGEEESFLMVPVWIFTGKVYLNGEAIPDNAACQIVINAVDGSVINTNLGY